MNGWIIVVRRRVRMDVDRARRALRPRRRCPRTSGRRDTRLACASSRSRPLRPSFCTRALELLRGGRRDPAARSRPGPRSASDAPRWPPRARRSRSARARRRVGASKICTPGEVSDRICMCDAGRVHVVDAALRPNPRAARATARVRSLGLRQVIAHQAVEADVASSPCARAARGTRE